MTDLYLCRCQQWCTVAGLSSSQACCLGVGAMALFSGSSRPVVSTFNSYPSFCIGKHKWLLVAQIST